MSGLYVKGPKFKHLFMTITVMEEQLRHYLEQGATEYRQDLLK